MTGSSWQAISALVDPVRRALYEYVRRQDHAVTREEAADAVGISRHLTAFHLDKLVDIGLLEARYESPTGQPRGRGRTPKVYEPRGDGFALMVPPRHYEVVGQILADAVAQAPTDASATAERGAFEYGRRVGAAAPPGGLEALSTVLTDAGFEPRRTTRGCLRLRNCPFRALAQRQPDLICGLNLALVRGMLAGMDAPALVAELDPQPGCCCVTIREGAAA